ncbi:phage regulatory protein [Latilactobacillus curvatus]|nr:phage regulatory protein [Latilactobacillus curvatus]
MHEQQAVTTSLQVADAFGKQHKHVIEAIEAKLSTAENSALLEMFQESTYQARNGKLNKMYYMNRDGFTFIAMGFTGQKADGFKLKYISAFNEMEKSVKAPIQLPSTPQEMLALVMTNVNDSNAEVKRLGNRMDSYEDNMPLSPGEYSFLSRRVRQRVGEVARGFGHLSSKQRGQLFRDINQGIKQISGVDTRSQLREKNYEGVMAFIQDWEPSTATKTVLRQYIAEAE